MRRRVWLFVSAAVLLLLLSGCRGNKLPDGMDEDSVSSAGLAVMSQLTKGEYEAVYDVTDADEPHGIAVIRAKYDKKSVIFRIAFDTEMHLIGLDVRGK